jgi:hypothetical protein
LVKLEAGQLSLRSTRLYRVIWTKLRVSPASCALPQVFLPEAAAPPTVIFIRSLAPFHPGN